MDVLVLAALAGCKQEPETTTLPDDDELLPASPTLALDASTNVLWEGLATTPHSTLQDGQDFEVDWSGLTVDLLGAPFDPTAVRGVSLTAVTSSLEQVSIGLGRGALEPSATEGRWIGQPDGTRVRASTLLDDYGPFDPATWVSADQTLLFMLLDQDQQVLSAATAAGGGSGGTLTLDDSAALTFTLTPSETVLSTEVGSGPWTIDWSAMTTTAAGVPMDPLGQYQLWLATIPGSNAPEADWITDPEPVADDWYVAAVNEVSSLPADELLASNATFFPGFEEPGTWFIGIRCTRCSIPVPQYVGEIRVLE